MFIALAEKLFIFLILFIHRDDLVDLVGTFQYDDEVTECGDVFARDPYILRFRCLTTGRRLSATHTENT